MIITMQPTAPYDFHKLMDRLRSHNEVVSIVDDCIVRPIRLDLESEPFLIRAKSIGSIENPVIEVHIDKEFSVADLTRMQTQLERMFTTNMDIPAFYEKMQEDPVMASVVERHYGLRLFTDSNLFESVVRTIIGQQLNVAFAATLTRRLATVASEPLQVNGHEYLVFPSPTQVASMTVDQLRELQFSTRKAEYVIDFAKAVCDGTVDLDQLYTMEDEQVIETLVPLRGIGRWTVECLLLFGMGRPNLLPAADIGLRNAVRHQYGLDHQPSEFEVREIGAGWEPYCSYATYYLWETLKEGKKTSLLK